MYTSSISHLTNIHWNDSSRYFDLFGNIFCHTRRNQSAPKHKFEWLKMEQEGSQRHLLRKWQSAAAVAALCHIEPSRLPEVFPFVWTLQPV